MTSPATRTSSPRAKTRKAKPVDRLAVSCIHASGEEMDDWTIRKHAKALRAHAAAMRSTAKRRIAIGPDAPNGGWSDDDDGHGHLMDGNGHAIGTIMTYNLTSNHPDPLEETFHLSTSLSDDTGVWLKGSGQATASTYQDISWTKGSLPPFDLTRPKDLIRIADHAEAIANQLLSRRSETLALRTMERLEALAPMAEAIAGSAGASGIILRGRSPSTRRTAVPEILCDAPDPVTGAKIRLPITLAECLGESDDPRMIWPVSIEVVTSKNDFDLVVRRQTLRRAAPTESVDILRRIADHDAAALERARTAKTKTSKRRTGKKAVPAV
jgi:hypothetical protein